MGCGAVVERFHLPALRHVAGVELAALVESDSRRLRRLGRMHPTARLCQDVDELSTDTDAALVAVPPGSHSRIAMSLLHRRVHVLCEKPMATTVEDCQRMIDVSRQSGAILMVGHHKRFLPSVQKAKEFLANGLLGKIRNVTASMGLRRTWRSHTAFHLDHKVAGGGVLMDNGVHLVNLILWLLGAMEVIRCELVPATSLLEEEAKLVFRVGADTWGVLMVSDQRMLANTFRVEGDEGFLEFDTFDKPLLKVFLTTSPLCRASGSIAFSWPSTNPYRRQLETFVRSIRGEEQILTNQGEEGMQSIKVVTKAYGQTRQRST